MPRSFPRVIQAKRTVEERREQRAGIRLRDFTITQATKARYEKAVSELLPFLESTADLSNLDQIVSDWIELAWTRGFGVNNIADALSGLHHFWPGIRGQLRESWRLFKSWRRIESPERAAPITFLLVRSFIARAVGQNDLAYATLLALGFHGLLRTGEFLALRFGDLEWNSTSGVISLHASKTGLRMGSCEAVAIRDPLTLKLLDTYFSLRTPFAGDLLWPHSAQHFRDHFRRSCEFFHVDHLKLKPYSLRRGGATLLLQHNVPLEIILVKGRWRSVGVARLYLEDGLAQLPGLRLPPADLARVNFYAAQTAATAFQPWMGPWKGAPKTMRPFDFVWKTEGRAVL